MGIGFYEGAIAAALGIFAILTILQQLDRRVHKKIRTLDLYVELTCNTALSDFLHSLRELDLRIDDLQFEADGSVDANSRAILLSLKSKEAEDHVVLCDKIKRIDGVLHLEEL